MTICKALEPVVSVKQKVCCQTDSSSFIPRFIHVSAKCYFFYLFVLLHFNTGRDFQSPFKNTTSLWKSDRVSLDYCYGRSQ